MKAVWPALFAGCALVSPGCSRNGPPAVKHANVRGLECSCAVAWPVLIRVIENAGFRLVAKDDAGRIATFMWLGAQLPAILQTAHERENLAIGPDGSARKSKDLRVESAVLTLSPHRRGCEAKILVSYQGQQGLWGGRWSKMESTGLLENRFLAALRLPASRGRRPMIANGGTAPSEPTRTARRMQGLSATVVSAEPGAAATDGGHTAVYDLGRH